MTNKFSQSLNHQLPDIQVIIRSDRVIKCNGNKNFELVI